MSKQYACYVHELEAELHQANRRAAAFEHRVAELLEENKILRESNKSLTRYIDEAAGEESCLVPISTLAEIGKRAETAEAELRRVLDARDDSWVENVRLRAFMARLRALLTENEYPPEDHYRPHDEVDG